MSSIRLPVANPASASSRAFCHGSEPSTLNVPVGAWNETYDSITASRRPSWVASSSASSSEILASASFTTASASATARSASSRAACWASTDAWALFRASIRSSASAVAASRLPAAASAALSSSSRWASVSLTTWRLCLDDLLVALGGGGARRGRDRQQSSEHGQPAASAGRTRATAGGSHGHGVVARPPRTAPKLPGPAARRTGRSGHGLGGGRRVARRFMPALVRCAHGPLGPRPRKLGLWVACPACNSV